MTFKIDKGVKARAQAAAAAMGIPLSTVINMYLRDFAVTGRLEVTAAEDMTEQTERIIEEFRVEVGRGDLSPKFKSSKEAEDYLRSL